MNGTTKTITVGVSAIVKDVNVTANITHPYVGDLTTLAHHPANTTIPLSVRRGGSGDNFTSTVFDDEAAISIASGYAPFTGSYAPDNPLSAADGQGRWETGGSRRSTAPPKTLDSSATGR